jgi:putative transposase
MAGALSIDLRERVVDAVVREGMSRRGAAERFGVGVSTAIAWVARFHATGSVAPGQMGGHRPRKLTGAWREWLLERCRTDFTLRGLVAELAERGMQVDYKTVWEFVHGEKLTHKKRR